MSTPQSYPIVGIAYVGKNNKPIYVHSFEDSQESDLDVNLTVHSCLDILDERADPSSPSYLGFLALETERPVALVLQDTDRQNID